MARGWTASNSFVTTGVGHWLVDCKTGMVVELHHLQQVNFNVGYDTLPTLDLTLLADIGREIDLKAQTYDYRSKNASQLRDGVWTPRPHPRR